MHGEDTTSAVSGGLHRFGTARAGWFRELAAPLGLLLVCPPSVVLLWLAATYFDGSLLLLLKNWTEIFALWPWPSLSALGMLAVWAALQAALLRWLPGKIFYGPATPMGNRPAYKLNGVAAYVLTHVLLWLAAYPLGLFSPTIIYDHFGELLMTLSGGALVLCVFLFVKGTRSPCSSDSGRSGNIIWDFFWGVELHPTVGSLNLKQLVNCRIAMMGWSVIILSFAAKQQALHGAISTAMVAALTLQLVYIIKFFVWESGYFTSLDMTHDRFGFYIAWGVLSWLPSVYTLASLYLVTHPGDLSPLAAVAIVVIGVAFIVVNYQADAQRQRVRETNGETTVWGGAPELIVARYRTGDGQTHQSLLLASGWWGVARHFHYTAEVAAACLWTLPAGFDHFLPWFYPVFLATLLFDRAGRDDLRCRGKYGPYWERYCERVPWRIVPGIY